MNWPGPSLLPVLGQVADYIELAEGAGYGTRAATVLAMVGAIVFFSVLLGGSLLALRWFRANLSKNSSPPVRILPRETRARVQKAVSTGEYVVAGDILARAGESFEAAENYIRGGAYEVAGEVFEKGGVFARAIFCYKRAGKYSHAGRVYEKMERPRDAAIEYYRGGDFEKAALFFEKAGDFRRAGENYQKAALFIKAADSFERANCPLLAAELYAQYLKDRGEGGLELRDLSGEDRDRARRAGSLFREAGEIQQASEIFLAAGFPEEAAETLRITGDFTRAAEMLLKANQPRLAAHFLEEAGEARKAAKMRADAALADGDKAEAAQQLREAGELLEAAKLFAETGEIEAAAELYEKEEHFEEAMQLYLKIPRFAHAARCAEFAGKLARAVEYYREAGDVDGELRGLKAQGDYFAAGRLQFEHRMYEEALKSLSKIDSRDANYPRSLELQGDLFRAQGRAEKAYSKYKSALGSREATAATLPLLYKMGRSLEEEPDLAGALECYDQIIALDEHFEDAELRSKAIRKRIRRGTMTGRTSSGIFRADSQSGSGGRYEIIEEIARGGMGIVYKAQDTVLGRIVAFKILGENLRDNETAVMYFLREARAAAALSHPNIVTIYDAGEQDGEYYMAMEYVEGTTLKDLIRKVGALSDEKVRYILVGCCRALHYAHSKGIIHRDIKSGNVMTTRDRALKVMDFGLAKFLREYQNNHTQQVGTPFYMSPEQIIGKDIDFRSDLYGLGCTIFECATGTVPFFKGDLSYHHLHTAPPRPRAINPGLSEEMEEVILKLLEKDPDHRYQNANEILDHFDE